MKVPSAAMPASVPEPSAPAAGKRAAVSKGGDAAAVDVLAGAAANRDSDFPIPGMSGVLWDVGVVLGTVPNLMMPAWAPGHPRRADLTAALQNVLNLPLQPHWKPRAVQAAV